MGRSYQINQINMKKISIYTTESCHFCKDVKAFLEDAGVKYESFDVGKDLKRRKEMVELSGQMAVPVTVIGDTVIVGFQKELLAKALRIKK